MTSTKHHLASPKRWWSLRARGHYTRGGLGPTPLTLTHQEQLDLRRPEVPGVHADEDVLRLALYVPVLLHTLAHPCDFGAHVSEGLWGHERRADREKETRLTSRGTQHQSSPHEAKRKPRKEDVTKATRLFRA